jgi:hypothetical protein
VDKETVSTSTLGEKLEEEMNSRNTHGVCDLATLMVFMKISCRLCDLATLMVFMKITSPLGSSGRSGQTVAASLSAFVLG